jgi:tRNA(Ile)-lysidine synthase
VSAGGVRAAFRAALEKLGVDRCGASPVVVACSGGLDSMVLLHLMRFAGDEGPGPAHPNLVAAHLDHCMRSGSAGDALWLRGVCTAWGIPMRAGVAGPGLTTEESARDARYDFFESVRTEVGARHVLTAHHADDQAETILFRALRGTGLAGLRGIPGTRSPGIVRPLLGLWREELASYAAVTGLRWREDATNAHLTFARNALRHDVIPSAEANVSSSARKSLVRLGRLAEANGAAWAVVLPSVLSDLGEESTQGGTSVDAKALLDLGPALQARVVRHLASGVTTSLDRAAVQRAVAHIERGRSGTGVDLVGGVTFRRELDRFVLGRTTAPLSEDFLEIAEPGSGTGAVKLGDRAAAVEWSPGSPGTTLPGAESFAIRELEFPLCIRGRAPGDRIRLPGGTRKVKKVLLEARIPASERGSLPILVDGGGRVLWLPGVARTDAVSADGDTLMIGIQR